MKISTPTEVQAAMLKAIGLPDLKDFEIDDAELSAMVLHTHDQHCEIHTDEECEARAIARLAWTKYGMPERSAGAKANLAEDANARELSSIHTQIRQVTGEQFPNLVKAIEDLKASVESAEIEAKIVLEEVEHQTHDLLELWFGRAAGTIKACSDTATLRFQRLEFFFKVLSRIGAGILFLLLALLLQAIFGPKLHAQVDCVGFYTSAGALVRNYCAPFRMKEGTGITFSASGNTLTVASSAGAGVAWSAITNPAGNLALTMAGFTSTFTYNATTGAAVTMFDLVDTASNTGTGYIFRSRTAASSAAKAWGAFARGTANGWELGVTGDLTQVGTASLAMLNTTTSTSGVLLKGGTRYMHNYNDPTSDGNNLFMGLSAGNFTMGPSGGASNLGSYNTGVGQNALTSQTTGWFNSAFGSAGLGANTTGYWNSAFGAQALVANTIGYDNVGVGTYALTHNIDGYNNTAIGTGALNANTSGFANACIGYNSCQAHLSGFNNVAIGPSSAYNVTIGQENVSLGAYNHYTNITGSGNVMLGNKAGYFETGSYKLFIDDRPRASEADGRVKALMYGVFDDLVANQTLTVNGALTVTQGITGNASTATALAADPADCSGNNFALGIVASGVATCAQPAFTNLSGALGATQLTITSGGIPYGSAANTYGSSGALTANLPVIGGGAGAAPSVGTRSGNTTAFVTTTGAQTNGDCVKIDANGNHIANGSACAAGSGTVTSVSWTGGLVSVATPTTTPAFTIAGTSGGIPYFSGATTWATSAALAAGAHVFGGGAAVTPATVTYPDVQVFAATGTWTKPTAFVPQTVQVICYGGGGGGGSGEGRAVSNARTGGGGGGGGAYISRTFLPGSFGATVEVTIGAAGTAGSPGGTAADGTAGGSGGNSCFSTTTACAGTIYATAYGGGGGGPGSATVGGGGGGGTGSKGGLAGAAATTGGSPTTASATAGMGGGGGGSSNSGADGKSAEYGGGGGGNTADGVGAFNGGSSIFAAGAGGSGGGDSNANPGTQFAGGAGGACGSFAAAGGGTAGSAGAGTGGTGATGSELCGGAGGGGGGGSNSATGGIGGPGGVPGGGGGGGAGGTNVGGVGGAGALGKCWVITK